LGLRVERTLSIRLVGIDAPEKRGATVEAGRAARDYLIGLLMPGGQPVPLIVTFEKGKSFDRWLGRLYFEDGQNIEAMIVQAGHAVAVP